MMSYGVTGLGNVWCLVYTDWMVSDYHYQLYILIISKQKITSDGSLH